MPDNFLVDSHCHLDFPDYAGQVDGVVARAGAAGVGVCLTIGTELKRFPGVRAVAEKFPNVWCSVGVHPHEAEKELLDDEAALIREAAHPKVVGIGETGLDYYYEHSPRQPQQANFRSHISAARQTGLPVIVHTRDADDDTIDILRDEMGKGAFTGLIHCFTGTQKLADAALALGLYISISGIATFKNSAALRDVIKSVPLDRLLVETDAPFLAPVPHRGKTNEPAFVVHTAKMLAELKGVTPEVLATTTTENFFHLFSKVARPA
jgi:TatD DNase family protein